MGEMQFDPHKRTIPMEKRRGGGRPMPKPAGGKAKQWKIPSEGTTPADRKRKDTLEEA